MTLKTEKEKNMKKYNKKIISVLSLALLLFAGCQVYKPSSHNLINDSSLEVNKKEAGIKIKNLATRSNSEGKEVISFNYEVLPEEANDKSVSTSLTWSDASVQDDINDFLSYTHDNENFKVEITCLQKSNNQAKFTLVSNANNEASASVLIDFEQEFLGFTNDEITLTKNLSLESSEKILSEQDIKEEILKLSKGFLGTISINDKEISNFVVELNNVSLSLKTPEVNDLLSNDQTLTNVYKEARSNELSNDFVNKIADDYIKTISNANKKTIRSSDTLVLEAVYEVTFTYYGNNFTFTCDLVDNIATSAFAEATYVNVESIETEGNIIFK